MANAVLICHHGRVFSNVFQHLGRTLSVVASLLEACGFLVLCKGDLKINHPVTKKLRLKITKENL